MSATIPQTASALTHLDNGVLHLTFNRADARNAMSLGLLQDIMNVFEAIKDDRGVRAVVMRGAGGHFCAGGDIKDMANARAAKLVEDSRATLGGCPGSEETYLGLRGLRTLGVRLNQHQRSAVEVAEWLARRPEVARVLCPALPSDPGHAVWKAQYCGASGLFSIILRPTSRPALAAMLVMLASGVAWLAWVVPLLRYRHAGYRVDARGIEIRRGVWWRSIVGVPRSRIWFSNYGKIVNVQGWGWHVTTLGYGDAQGGASENTWYTLRFSGTSSASPIVTGAVACLQGRAKAKNGAPMTPDKVRKILVQTGTPQQAGPGVPVSQHVGPLPNLVKAMTKV